MRSIRLSTPFLLLLVFGLSVVPAGGQSEPSDPGERPAEDPTVTEVREALQAAAAGDLGTAIEKLETLRDEGPLPEPVVAALGALYVETDRPLQGLELLKPLAEEEDADPAVLYNAGRAALSLGRTGQAEPYLERSVALEPGTPAARELGLLRGAQKRYREAYRLLRPWVERHPEDEEARLAAALCAVQLRRVPEAEELLSTLSQTDPATGVLWGRLLLLKGEPHAALTVLEPLVEEVPPGLEADLRRTLAEASLEIGESDRAVRVLEGRTEGNPRSTLLLARALYQGGDPERALETLRPLAQPLLESGIDPEHPGRPLASRTAGEYGRWLVNAGRNKEAVPFLRLATESRPRHKEAWKALGQALAATGDREEARAALERFQELAREEGPETERVNRARLAREDPTAAEMERARELFEQDRPEEALEILRAERQINPEDLRPWLLESRLLLVLGRNEEALSLAEKIVKRAPVNPDALYQRGSARMALERFEAARRDLERALELDPGHVAAMNDLAVLLILEGKHAEARELLNRVLEIRPDDPVAAQTLQALDARQN